MNISFESLVVGNLLRFCHQRLVASRCNYTPLMECQGTEITVPKTAAIAYQTEFYFFNGRNAAFFFIHRMISTLKIQCVHTIQLICPQWWRWWILHHSPLIIFLNQCFANHRVCILILDQKTFRILHFVLFDFIILRQNDIVICSGNIFCLIYRTAEERQFFHRQPAGRNQPVFSG